MNPTRSDPPVWHQTNIHFDAWEKAEPTVVENLAPILAEAEALDLIRSWFFTRKAPCWRFRMQVEKGERHADLASFLHKHLQALQANRQIAGWTTTIYEPETHAFGGPAGMDIAHQLFHRDSSEILRLLAGSRPQAESNRGGRRKELALLLTSAMMRAAGQDWYEQGDIWARTARHRTLSEDAPIDHLAAIEPVLRRFLTVDIDALTCEGQPFADIPDWVDAFRAAGSELSKPASDGTLIRGLRAVLAHHILFAWNRLGLPHDTQAVLAHVARTVVFDE